MPKGLGTQIIAAILGILFVIGLILLGRKIGQDLRNRFLAQRGDQTKGQITPTPSPSLNNLVVIKKDENKQKTGETLSTSTQTKGGVTEIPKTGAESLIFTTLLIPAGYYLRKR